MAAITYADTRVNQGGLMRCCLASLADFVEAHAAEPAAEGMTLDCAYEKPGNANLVLEGRVWRWNRPAGLGSPRS